MKSTTLPKLSLGFMQKQAIVGGQAYRPPVLSRLQVVFFALKTMGRTCEIERVRFTGVGKRADVRDHARSLAFAFDRPHGL